jgi:hypothetical protein
MPTPLSNRHEPNWVFAILMLFLIVLVGVLEYTRRTAQKSTIEALMSVPSRAVTSFRIHPEFSNPYDYKDAIEFAQEEKLIMAFFEAITDSHPYQPEHDRALTQWGMQIRTATTTIKIACHIPDHKPEVVAGHIKTASGSGDFQSRLLLRWYQKYGHYWKVGGYQKVQYSRVKPILRSISPEEVISFRIVPSVSELSTSTKTNEFSQDVELVGAFFQALEDMQFAAPKYKEFVDQWSIQIRTGTTTLSIACSIPADDPTVVIGLIDSSAGYSYFQSQKVLQWYQTYSHRWLEAGEREEEDKKVRR